MSKHTPGLWEVFPGGLDLRIESPCSRHDGERRILSDVVATVHPIERGDRDANAHLISAAPEMLEALKLAKPIIQYEQLHGRLDFADKITDAVAKAEGRDPEL